MFEWLVPNELKRVRQEAIVGQRALLSWHLIASTEENYEDIWQHRRSPVWHLKALPPKNKIGPEVRWQTTHKLLRWLTDETNALVTSDERNASVTSYGNSSDCADACHCTALRHARLHSNDGCMYSYWRSISGRCTVGQIERKLARIQILRIRWNFWKPTWGAKESSQDKENVSFMRVWFDLFPIRAHKQNVFLQRFGMYFVHEFR
jgi:hypothetical protein